MRMPPTFVEKPETQPATPKRHIVRFKENKVVKTPQRKSTTPPLVRVPLRETSGNALPGPIFTAVPTPTTPTRHSGPLQLGRDGRRAGSIAFRERERGETADTDIDLENTGRQQPRRPSLATLIQLRSLELQTAKGEASKQEFRGGDWQAWNEHALIGPYGVLINPRRLPVPQSNAIEESSTILTYQYAPNVYIFN